MRPTDLPPARVLRHPLGFRVEPAVAWRAILADEPNSFWLDSGQGAGLSYLGAGTRVIGGPRVLELLRAELTDAASRVTKDELTDAASREPADAATEAASNENADERADAASRGFALGWVGWLGYELRGSTVGTPVAHTPKHPVSALMFAERALEFDHDTGEVTLMALADRWTGDALAWRDATVAALETATARGAEPSADPADASPTAPAASAALIDASPTATATADWAYSDDEYLAMIRACQDAIHAGEAYQLCLTTEASVAGVFDPFATYLALRASSPAHHGGLLRVGGVALLSASPEQFLSISPGGEVVSRPIKGTRRRGATPREDADLAAELLASDKERAENLMIVDLMRNDIGRVSALGSVSVPELFVVESYRHVHQLVSTVRGSLAPGLDAIDAVGACFPAGSMTGAPKRNATLILETLEHRARGIYAGAFGYFSLDGRVDLAMVIRSIVLDAEGATVGAGGGITALSVPEEELDEAKLKAAALLAVLGA
jgi:para-aminobenzoate synthetase component 1